jgi:hypothetical protein
MKCGLAVFGPCLDVVFFLIYLGHFWMHIVIYSNINKKQIKRELDDINKIIFSNLLFVSPIR